MWKKLQKSSGSGKMELIDFSLFLLLSTIKNSGHSVQNKCKETLNVGEKKADQLGSLDPKACPSFSYIMRKNQLKIDERLNCKTWNHETPGGKHKGTLLDICLGEIFLFLFFYMTPKPQATKVKMNKWDYTKLKNFGIAKDWSTKWKGNLLN